MAFPVATKVRVADGSSEYRGHVGVVVAVVDDTHQVRIDGHGCSSRVQFLSGQLQEDFSSQPTNYSQC